MLEDKMAGDRLKMIVRAFAVDVDGTITDDEGLIDLDAIQAIRWLETIGVPAIIVSGKSYCDVLTLSMNIGTCGVVVAENGGIVGEGFKEPIIMGDVGRAEAGFKILKERLGDVVIPQRAPHVRRLVDIVLKQSFDINLGNKILRENYAEAHIVDSGVAYHLLDINVNKGAGLKRAAEILGLKIGEMVAIGDSLNDIDMFRVDGYGIALANATKETKENADYICRLRFGEGFCEAIEHIVEKFGLNPK